MLTLLLRRVPVDGKKSFEKLEHPLKESGHIIIIIIIDTAVILEN